MQSSIFQYQYQYHLLRSSDCFNLRLSQSERRVYHTALQVFKIVNNISPSYLHHTFSFAVDVTGRSGRNQHRLFVPRVRTNYGKRSLAYRGTAIWNRLPPALYSAKTVSAFVLHVVIFIFVCVYVDYLYCMALFSGHI